MVSMSARTFRFATTYKDKRVPMVAAGVWIIVRLAWTFSQHVLLQVVLGRQPLEKGVMPLTCASSTTGIRPTLLGVHGSFVAR